MSAPQDYELAKAWRLRNRYTVADICRLAEARFGVRYAEPPMGRLLKRLGLSRQKARPVHPKTDRIAQERFKKGA